MMKNKVFKLLYTISVVILISWMFVADSVVIFTYGMSKANEINLENYDTNSDMKMYIEEIRFNEKSELYLYGWVFVPNISDYDDYSVEIVFVSDKDSYVCPITKYVKREDVAEHFKGINKNIDPNKLGVYSMNYSLLNIDDNVYDIYIYATDNKGIKSLHKTNLQYEKSGALIEKVGNKETNKTPEVEVIKAKEVALGNYESNSDIEMYFDEFNFNDQGVLTLRGWVVNPTIKEYDNYKVEVLLTSENKSYSQDIKEFYDRPDVKEHFKDKYALEDTSKLGIYSNNYSYLEMGDGTYDVSIYVTDNKGRTSLHKTNLKYQKRNNEFRKIQ